MKFLYTVYPYELISACSIYALVAEYKRAPATVAEDEAQGVQVHLLLAK